MNNVLKGIAFATIATFAMGSTGCDAIKKMIGPRMDKPTIGTRVSAIASLDVKDTTSKAKYLGCDIKYWNMPAGAKIKLVWHVYEDEDGDGKADDDDPINKTTGKEQDVQGNGVINAYLQSLDGDFHPGVYECKWEAITSKKVEGGEQAAKIKVGDLAKKKKKGADDDDGDSKKKKKKSSDDD
jgi:hypothetical protein